MQLLLSGTLFDHSIIPSKYFNYLTKARVPDPTKVCVAVGLGFFVELTLDEALAFVSKKDAALSKQVSKIIEYCKIILARLSIKTQAEQLSKECAKLKAHIKLVIGGLQELQQIGLEEPRKPQRDIFS